MICVPPKLRGDLWWWARTKPHPERRPWLSKRRRERCLVAWTQVVPCRGTGGPCHGQVVLFSAFIPRSSADSKRKTLRPKPQILIMEMHRSTAWHLARSETASSPSRLSPESG